jgi:hypothetical protein
MYEFEKTKLKEYLGDILDILENSNAFIAGGAIRSIFCGEDISDIDVYFRTKEDALNFIIEVSVLSTSIFISEKSYTSYHAGDKNLCIQSIYFDYFDSPKEIFDSFDFTCCMGAYDTKDGEFYFNDRFLADNCKKEIHINSGTKFPIISLSRIIKYQKKGYKVQPSEVIKLGVACTKLDINAWEDFISHCGGMYGGITISEEAKKKEFSIDLAFEEISRNPVQKEYCRAPSEDMLKTLLSFKGTTDNLFCFDKTNKIYVFKTKEHDYVFKDENDFVSGNKKEIDRVILYKKVTKNKISGRLSSSFKSSFEYIIGEKQVAENTSYGLFFTTWSSICKDNICEAEVIIECECLRSDFMNANGKVFQFKECKTLREVSSKELENIIVSDPF